MSWLIFAFLSALFVAITAILAKIGVSNINSNLATAIRAVVIMVFSWSIVFFQGGVKDIYSISKHYFKCGVGRCLMTLGAILVAF